MAYAVREIELTRSPSQLENLEGYEKLLLVFRYRNIPVGARLFPVRNGRFVFRHTDDLLSGAIRNQVAEIALQEYLNFSEFEAQECLPPATVAVCTRNRSGDLARCLEAILKLQPAAAEVLVVDNCPSDDSSLEVVRRYPSVRYVREERPGLDVARNRALAEASHEIVAFTDDDALPDAAWLQHLLAPFSHPLVMCVTGLTMPLELETQAQIQFELYSPFCKGFRRRRWRVTHCNPLATGAVGAGANMALRKSVVTHTGGFDEALDAGTATHSGGDHELFARILSYGYEIVYEPGALNWHRHRQTMEALEQALYGYGSGVYAHWARMWAVEKEFSVVRLPVNWFFRVQLPRLARSLLKRPQSVPAALLLAELKGCRDGISNYNKARKKLKAGENL